MDEGADMTGEEEILVARLVGGHLARRQPYILAKASTSTRTRMVAGTPIIETDFEGLPIEVLDSRTWPVGTALSMLRQEAAQKLAGLLPQEAHVTADALFRMLEKSRSEEHGLFALPCPQLRLPGSPVALAQDLAARFPTDAVFVGAAAAGPFVNITVAGAHVVQAAVREALAAVAELGGMAA